MLRRAAVLVLGLLGFAAPAPAQQQTAPPERGISVVGDAESFADNDLGTFRFGVSVRRRTPGAALRSAGAAVQRVIGSARAGGVAREDIRSDVVALERVRSRRTRRVTYIARNAVLVTVRRLADAGRIVDRAVGAGATSVDGPSFGVADARGVYRRTLAAAFAEARAKAQQLAAEAGLTLGPALRIRESGFEEGVDESGERFAQAETQSAAGSTPVAPGRTRITASVAVTFAVQ